jgi:hypothetical protein
MTESYMLARDRPFYVGEIYLIKNIVFIGPFHGLFECSFNSILRPRG